jgi:molybdenum cofactor synthesis domain-containing protein
MSRYIGVFKGTLMKLMSTREAVGQTLCHDVTQIIKDVTKGALFRKGHVIKEEDVTVLLSLGKEHIYIWEDDENMLHENDAAEILRAMCQSENMRAVGPKEGKIELLAEIDGLFLVDTEALRRVNDLGQMLIASRVSGFPVKKGDKLCGVRIIPLLIEKEKMENARQAAGDKPLLRLLPIKPKKYGLVITGGEVFHKRIQDTFTPVIQEKLTEYGCEMTAHEIIDDDHKKITAAINSMLDKGAEMVFCTGGMSVDPDDKTPLAIRNAAGNVVSYGAPVLPGSMFMLAYTADKRPVCGLPGCVMYARRTIFDLVLPYLLADAPVSAEWLAGLGNGGLCLDCVECHFPNCSFGKGI